MHKIDHLTSVKKWIENLKVSFGSILADPQPVLKGPATVRSRHTITYAECRTWVDSGCLVISYLESVPRSHYGGKAVVQQMAIITPVIITVLPESATGLNRSPSGSGWLI